MIVEAIFAYVYDIRFLYQLVASLTVFSVIRVAKFVQVRRRRFRLFEYYGIRGPKPRLLDGNYGFYNSGLTHFHNDEQLVKEYGKIYGVFVGDEPVIMTTDLGLIKKVFLESSSYFHERTTSPIESPFATGILFAHHARWKFMRRVLSPAFSMYNVRGTSSTQFIETSVKLMIEYVDKRYQEARVESGNASIDIYDLMKSTSLHLISKMAIKLPGVQVMEGEPNVKSLDKFLATGESILVHLAIICPVIQPMLEFLYIHLAHNSALAQVHHGSEQVIKEGLERLSQGRNRPSSQPTEIMETLIKLLHEGQMSKEEVVANVDNILIAAYDTTSTTLAYTFWALAKHPDIQEKLREELITHGIESKYLSQVINESMRLYPALIIFTSRLATQTLVTDNLTIPEGAKVVYNTWIVHRDPEIWPDPTKFDPERFQDDKIDPCAFAPFGLGDRRCLGYQLALLELKTIICELLLRFRLKLKSPQNLFLIRCATYLSKPKEKVLIELDRL